MKKPWINRFSKKDNKILGLILPAITFLTSILWTLLNVALTEGMTAWEIFSAIGVAFILLNIPTLVLLAIYFACRDKIRRKKQLEKMDIQDLE